ncbi:MAG TPA: hypothetical protein VJ765_09660 [Chitinophagaceae bacterium]|nr:hypothetical protein [Chitinophagaceae bacterium]
MKSKIYIEISLTAIIALILITCKKENSSGSINNPATDIMQPDTTQVDTTQYIKPYSGTWKGAIQVTDVNPSRCYFSGDPVSVIQNWKVKTDSSVKIEESYTDLGSSTRQSYIWEGSIHHNDSIAITSSRTINCFGQADKLVVNIKAKIIKNVDRYSLETSLDYPMCPPDCLFIFNYLMTED